MRKLVVSTLMVAAVVAASVPAVAHDHRPPRTKLTARNVEQAGRLGSYCWSHAGDEPGFHERLCVDAIFSWPQAQRTRAGRPARIRIFKTTAPEDFSLRAWRRVDENQFPVGDGRALKHQIRQATVDGRTVHDVTFRLPGRPGHLYIEMFGTWQDTEGGDTLQDAFWHFHLRLR